MNVEYKMYKLICTFSSLTCYTKKFKTILLQDYIIAKSTLKEEYGQITQLSLNLTQ